MRKGGEGEGGEFESGREEGSWLESLWEKDGIGGLLVPRPAACGLGFWIGGGDECKSLLLNHGEELDTSNWTVAMADMNYSAEII
jgi:hypothetical protein